MERVFCLVYWSSPVTFSFAFRRSSRQLPQICLIFLTRLGICELLKTNAIVKNLQVVAVKATTVSSSVVRVDFILCEYNAH